MAKRKRVRNEPRINPSVAKEYGFHDKKDANSERYVSPNEAAKILNVTGECIKQWIYHRRLPAVKLSNGYWKISIADLEKFMAAKEKPDNRKVLLFDRAGSPLQSIAAQLESNGFEVIFANNHMDALLKAVDLIPGLFLVNVSLDGGWNLIKKVRESRHVRRLPILVITETVFDNETLDSAMSLDIQGVVQSPYTLEDILREMKALFRGNAAFEES